MNKKPNPYAGHRYPTEIISHAVWLYFRFTLSFRDVEDILAYRGVIITYEAIRQWTLKFGQDYANTLRRRQPKRGDTWHLDEVVLTMNSKHHYLWRAVDQDGYTLDILVGSDALTGAGSGCSQGLSFMPPAPLSTSHGHPLRLV